MLYEQTLATLKALKLHGMAQALEAQAGVPDISDLSFEDRLGLLVEQEAAAREARRLRRLLQLARLREPHACVEDLDYRSRRGLDRTLMLRLAHCDWIRQHQQVLIVGATGTGKTYVASALGHSACRHGLTVRFYRIARLLNELALARADGSYGKLLTTLAKVELLIIDDWGLAPLADRERRDLLEVLDDRFERRATLVTSQLPLEHWHEVVGEATFGDAILDRLVHNAHRLVLEGRSMRGIRATVSPPSDAPPPAVTADGAASELAVSLAG